MPNAHSSISAHNPEGISWYPDLQTHNVESAPDVWQVAPSPQLQICNAVVVTGCEVDVKVIGAVVDVCCGVVITEPTEAVVFDVTPVACPEVTALV